MNFEIGFFGGRSAGLGMAGDGASRFLGYARNDNDMGDSAGE